MIRAILACDNEYGIGKDNTLPWPHNSKDLQWFKQQTQNGIVVMGRNTWESLPVKPLPKRHNIVVSNTMSHGAKCEVVPTDIFRSRIEIVRGHEERSIWFIGGATLVESYLDLIDEIWLSRVRGTYDCDTFLPMSKIKTLFSIYEIDVNGIHIERWKKHAN
jgi:dihydrofolate reductase